MEAEGDLIAAARAGDQRAVARLVAPHRDRLWAVCLRTTRNAADAEDALQECLIAVWRNLHRFRGDAALSTWMHRIAANAALAVVRRRREESEHRFDDHPAPGDFVDELAERDRVETALRQVPEHFRAALVLREYGRLTYEEIAQHQGILVQTVKSRISRARAAVAAVLAAE